LKHAYAFFNRYHIKCHWQFGEFLFLVCADPSSDHIRNLQSVKRRWKLVSRVDFWPIWRIQYGLSFGVEGKVDCAISRSLQQDLGTYAVWTVNGCEGAARIQLHTNPLSSDYRLEMLSYITAESDGLILGWCFKLDNQKPGSSARK